MPVRALCYLSTVVLLCLAVWEGQPNRCLLHLLVPAAGQVTWPSHGIPAVSRAHYPHHSSSHLRSRRRWTQDAGGSWHLPGFPLVLPGELVSPPLISLPPSHGPLFPGDSLEVAFALSLSRWPPNPAGLVLRGFSECEHFPQGQSRPSSVLVLFHSVLTMSLMSS